MIVADHTTLERKMAKGIRTLRLERYVDEDGKAGHRFVEPDGRVFFEVLDNEIIEVGVGSVHEFTGAKA